MNDVESLITRLNDELKKEYIVIGEQRVKSWDAWLIIGIVVGIFSGIIFVANRSGELDSGLADSGEQSIERYAKGEILIKFKDTVSFVEEDKLLNGWGFEKKSKIKQIGVHIVKVPEEAETQLAEALSKNPKIEFAEVNWIGKVVGEPNDSGYVNQWHLPKISAPDAWNINTGSKNIIVGVADSGADTNHADLAPNLVGGWNFITNTNNVFDDGSNGGHGTAVSGVIAAVGNNSLGVSGVEWSGSVSPLVVVKNGAFYYSDLSEALTWAADNGIKIVNMSLVGSDYSATLDSAVQYAYGKGVILIASAGNENTSSPKYPANISNVISVAATTYDDSQALYPQLCSTCGSNYGSWIDVAAPGYYIYTTMLGGGYGNWVGTSFSSPIVAGEAALLLSANSSLSACQVEALIKGNVDPYNSSLYLGTGRINIQKALSVVNTPPSCSSPTPIPPPPPPPPPSPADSIAPTISITQPANSSKMPSKGNLTITATASDNIAVSQIDILFDGVLRKQCFNATSCTVKVATSKIVTGTYTILGKAYDLVGNSSSASINVIK